MMDELNALIAPKKVVDGLAEVFDGLAQMFAGVSEQLDTLAANAEQEEKLELPVAVQPPIPAVSEKKGTAALHPRQQPVKKTRKVEEPASVVMEDEAEDVPTVEESTAEETVNSESSESTDTEHPVDDADALPWPEDTDQKDAPAEEQPTVAITKDDITAVIVAKIKKKRDNNAKIGQLLKTYGVVQLSDLPAEKYEAFLADVSQI